MVAVLDRTQLAADTQAVLPRSMIWWFSQFAPSDHLKAVVASLHKELHEFRLHDPDVLWGESVDWLSRFIKDHPHDYVYVDLDAIPPHHVAYATASTTSSDRFLGMILVDDEDHVLAVYWVRDCSVETVWEAGKLLVEPTGIR